MTSTGDNKICDCAFVTGGGGFLGKAIAKHLLNLGIRTITFSRGEYPELSKLGAEHRRGDLTDYNGLHEAMKECDAVFHVAAKPGIWGSYSEYYQANVVGTLNVISCCRMLGIQKLVYTSSPSVVFNGKDMENADESTPWPAHYEAWYPMTKAIAERHVLSAADTNMAVTDKTGVQPLAVVALRPHIIWGPGDRHLIPRLINRAKQGALRIVGDGNNLIDTIYIDNAAEAHILAMERLYPGSEISGKAYFISQGEPVNAWEFMNSILKISGLSEVTKSISYRKAWMAGLILENIWKVTGKMDEPRMTRFLAGELATSHWFDISAARRELGYEPRISIAEGLERLSLEINNNPGPP